MIVYDNNEHKNHPYVLSHNKGKEAVAYLRYIIDYYDHLTPFTIFLQDCKKRKVLQREQSLSFLDQDQQIIS